MIIKHFLFLTILLTSLSSKTFSIASYNVENFFDLKYDKTEYKEFIPNQNSKWNKETFNTKLNNLLRVIKDLDKDIIALQEVESQEALNSLLKHLPKYKYHKFIKSNNSSIGLCIISKYEIISSKTIKVKYNNVNRDILELIVKIDNNKIRIFNNHWPSKRKAENQRVLYAQTLQNYIKNLNKDIDYIILGDLNSNYNENETFKYNKKLNNTYNITGINDVLNTTIDNAFIKKFNILSYKKRVHYNLWLELNYKDRFSYKYKGENNTPDNMILPASLFDNKNISYITNSFNVFKPNYLFNKATIYRWQIKNGIHKNIGFSDHLPIYAEFSTKKVNNLIEKKDLATINDLYKTNEYNLPLKISNMLVIYKNGNSAILKQEKNRAIYAYNSAKNLKIGFKYDIEIQNIIRYNGLLEVSELKILNKQKYIKKYNKLFLDANKIDILNSKYQNEIITNLKAIYKDKYLHYKYKGISKKIRVYSKNSELLPKNGQKITIINAHLGFYKSKPQIIIYKKSDINVN